MRERGAAFKEVRIQEGAAGRAGIAWIRTKVSLKTNGQATWVSSVLPLGRGKLAEVTLEGRKLREGIIDASGTRRGMGFGLGAAVGQPEAQMFQDHTDRIGVFDCRHDALLITSLI